MPPDETTETPTPKPQPKPTAENMVPYDRFAAVVQERDRLNETSTDLATRLAQAEGQIKTLPTLQAKIDELTGGVQRAEGRYAAFRTVAATGITEPEIVEAIEAHWQTLPKTSRPALDALLTEWRGTPETGPKLDAVPVLLRPHLAAAWGKPADVEKPQAQSRAGHLGTTTRGPPGAPAGQAEIFELAAKRQRGEISAAEYSAAIAATRQR